jgi:hypothetical protein
MKSIISASIMALFIACLAVPSLVLADAEGSSASGSFKFLLDDGETRFVEFRASELAEGQGAGEMVFSDPAAIPVVDPDDPREKNSPGVLVRAKFDCMETTNNTAVMGGEIFESNVPSVIGLRVLLVVEDNGVQGADDKLAWGIYQQPATGWIPVDAERPDDRGAFLKWIATDFERKDDVGIPMPPNRLVACRSFPLASYDFPEFKYGGGDLLVQEKR